MNTRGNGHGQVRSSALWGTGNRGGDSRKSALWGKRGRGAALLLVVSCASVFAAGANATNGDKGTPKGDYEAQIPKSLVAQAQASPSQLFNVIVQGGKGKSSASVADEVGKENGATKKKFRSISGVSASLTGKDLLKLANHKGVVAITPDVRVRSTDYHAEMWRDTVGLTPLLQTGGFAPAIGPAIAIVDSGIDQSRPDFAGRVIATANFSSGEPLATGDQSGHGTMVAGIAAGSDSAHLGASPSSPLVDVRTANAQGQSMTSDVIAACDWILQNKAQYNIRVANFSLAGNVASSFRFDPLDQAVEKLWFSGIVVVAAAGNHGNGGPVPIYAPGNDPFVLTVGATDQNQTSTVSDDSTAPWSAHGHTADGFQKPELSAPGRYMVMPVPSGAALAASLSNRVVAPNYMWMSGTSFSAPVASGAAAQLLARHPDWSADQVKGALMVTANPIPGGFSAGVGEVNAAAAANVLVPPNPNLNLNSFVSVDLASGLPVFDQASWAAAVAGNASWAAASWSEASWAEASWSEASWAEASWSEASWAEASWAEASWAEATSSSSAALP